MDECVPFNDGSSKSAIVSCTSTRVTRTEYSGSGCLASNLISTETSATAGYDSSTGCTYDISNCDAVRGTDPTRRPTGIPSKTPSKGTNSPSAAPTPPTTSPTKIPTQAPSQPTTSPTRGPTMEPTANPTSNKERMVLIYVVFVILMSILSI